MRIQILFIFIYLNLSSLLADGPIALVTKSRGNAKYKISSESKFHTNAGVNTPIFHGNGIKTKAKSFAKIVYLDDRSTVSVYPQTEIIMHGTIENRMINKQVDVTEGILRVMVFNQISSKFKLTTPYSELTCHECEFWIISDKKTGDRFIRISGNGLVINSSMSETMELVHDSTIISMKDTEMEISQTPITESKYLELLILDSDEMPEILVEKLAIKSEIADQTPETISNIVEIRLKNALNIERKIILIYTE